MSSIKIVLGVAGIILIFFVVSGESIHCWVCSSDSERHCSDPFNASHYSLLDCDRDRSHTPYLQSLAVCKKVKKRINNEVITERSCGWEVSKNHDGGPCSQSSLASYVKQEYCSTCSTDACNGTNKLNLSLFFIFALPLATLIKNAFHF